MGAGPSAPPLDPRLVHAHPACTPVDLPVLHCRYCIVGAKPDFSSRQILSQSIAMSIAASLPAPMRYQSGENFERWLRGVEFYMTACGITTLTRKSATVLTLLDLEIQDVVRTLSHPQELPSDANEYQVLTAKLKAYYQPRVNNTYEMSVLHDIYRKDGESFETFVTRLRLQADRCQFDTGILDQTDLQCAVAHARSKELQKKFFL